MIYYFVTLTAATDPTGDEAHTACVTAKVPPGKHALVAFSVHSSGVDQVPIRKEWFTGAVNASPALCTMACSRSLKLSRLGRHRSARRPPYQGLRTSSATRPCQLRRRSHG